MFTISIQVLNVFQKLTSDASKMQGRSQYEASNRGTCLSHLRVDPSIVLFKRSHHKDPEQLGGELQARNQDFMWGGANQAKVDQTTEMYFILCDPFIQERAIHKKL